MISDVRGGDARTGEGDASLLEALPDLVAVVEVDGRICFVSRSAAELLGRSPDSLIGRRVQDLLAPDERRNYTTWLAHAAVSPTSPELVHRMIRADGSVAWFETRARWLPERCDPGRQVLIVSRDITARLEFEENSADSERLWQDVGSIIREGVIIASPDGTVITGNRRGAELLDVPLHRLPGITLAGRLLGQDPDSPLDTIEDGEILLTQLRAAGEHGMTCAVRMGNSEERPVRARAVMLADTEFSTQQGRVAVILEPAPHARDTNCAPVTPCPATLDELSPRELAVLRLLAAGLDVRAVSNELALSVHTTRYYVRSILRKLQVRTQLQAVVFAMQAGLPGLS